MHLVPDDSSKASNLKLLLLENPIFSLYNTLYSSNSDLIVPRSQITGFSLGLKEQTVS